MSQQGYIGRNPGDGRTIINRQTSHVTTGVQTSFTMTVGYEVGFLDVYLNGIKQTETLDYTAADGSTINFSPSFAPMNGDVLEFVAFETLNITNIKSARRNFSVGQDLDVSGKVTIGSSLTVASDLVVNGTFTTINTEILDVEDKTVGIASTSSPSNTTADGAGIVIYGGSDGDKSILWNTDKSNFVIVGGGVSIGTGVTISTPAANVLAFSVNSAEKARFNNFGAFTVGYEGEAWHESTYVGVLQAGSGAWIGQTPGASARAEWVNNAYYDSVNTRWEYIAADEANRIVLENGELKLQSADAGSADGAITWNEKLKMTVGGDFKIGAPTGIGITISSSGNVDSIGIVTASSFTGSGANLTSLNASNLGSGTVPTARLGSGTASSSTFLRGDSTFQTVNTDLVSDTSPQLGGNLDVNTKNILFGDSSDGSSDDALIFGAGSDLKIYHDSSNSYIKEAGTGQLKIQSANAIDIEKDDGTDVARFHPDGAVELFHNGIKRLETDTDGVRVVAPEGAQAMLRLIGDEGDDNDDYFRLNAGAGTLKIQDASNGSSWEDNIVINAAGGVELYHDNSKKMQTFSNGVEVTGSYIYMGDGVEVRCGGGSDLRLYHNGTHSYVQAYNTGNLYVGTTHSANLILLTGNTGRWSLNGSGHFLPEADNTYDLGTSSYRVKNIYSQELNVTKASGNLSAYFTATNGLGTLEIGGSTGAFIDLKTPSSDDFDLRIGTSGSGGYISGNLSVTGNITPGANNTYDLGSTSARWQNIYTNDLNLSNEGSQNDVDGTWGDYTIQEGESDLFLINKRSGKKFKFMLQEVS